MDRAMRMALAAGLGLAIGGGISAAQADGYPPSYAFSGYGGTPAIYFTHHPDVRQATTFGDGYEGFGTRTYYRGGPFYRIQANHPVWVGRSRHHRYRTVLRRRG